MINAKLIKQYIIRNVVQKAILIHHLLPPSGEPYTRKRSAQGRNGVCERRPRRFRVLNRRGGRPGHGKTSAGGGGGDGGDAARRTC